MNSKVTFLFVLIFFCFNYCWQTSLADNLSDDACANNNSSASCCQALNCGWYTCTNNSEDVCLSTNETIRNNSVCPIGKVSALNKCTEKPDACNKNNETECCKEENCGWYTCNTTNKDVCVSTNATLRNEVFCPETEDKINKCFDHKDDCNNNNKSESCCKDTKCGWYTCELNSQQVCVSINETMRNQTFCANVTNDRNTCTEEKDDCNQYNATKCCGEDNCGWYTCKTDNKDVCVSTNSTLRNTTFCTETKDNVNKCFDHPDDCNNNDKSESCCKDTKCGWYTCESNSQQVCVSSNSTMRNHSFCDKVTDDKNACVREADLCEKNTERYSCCGFAANCQWSQCLSTQKQVCVSNKVELRNTSFCSNVSSTDNCTNQDPCDAAGNNKDLCCRQKNCGMFKCNDVNNQVCMNLDVNKQAYPPKCTVQMANLCIGPFTTPAPPKKKGSFDGGSFIGGIILMLGVAILGFVGYKCYMKRKYPSNNYGTL